MTESAHCFSLASGVGEGLLPKQALKKASFFWRGREILQFFFLVFLWVWNDSDALLFLQGTKQLLKIV